MKVFKLNEFEFYAGEDEESVVTAAMKDSGLGREAIIDDAEFREISAEEMRQLFVKDDSGKYSKTFEDYLNDMISNGHQFPCFFAGYE